MHTMTLQPIGSSTPQMAQMPHTNAAYECRSADSECVGADRSVFCKKPHEM